MTITINGVDYAFNITGTVGLVYLAQRILGDEEFDGQNIYHQVVLYYAAFFNSNKDKKNVPDIQDFMASLTSKKMAEITTFFWEKWNELEGITPNSQNGDEKEQGED